jgi:inorganic phosphate transporter, PiT family
MEHYLLLVAAVAVALAFEFVNGFHDTANAVATVIYTRSLKSHWAVLYSGLLNFAGVMLAGAGVAYSIVHLFPLDSLLAQGAMSGPGIALVFSVLTAAIVWNLATWYVGIPASSSHALIGSIIGASMGYSLQQGIPLESGVPWDKARQIMVALLISPLFGFAAAALLLRLVRIFARDERLYAEPGERPPLWIRGLLIATCGGVSFAHGSNDGQKGMGLIMLILMGLAPASYCLNLSSETHSRAAVACRQAAEKLPDLRPSLLRSAQVWEQPLTELSSDQRADFRRQTSLQVKALKQAGLKEQAAVLEGEINYVSTWVKVAVALALGLGTMIGWKRVVVTVGEKIGKTHLSYAQGAAAELVAATTILLADILKMPVSTTHVLSSGVAGAMFAQRSGLQSRTLVHIGLAWVLTLPVCISLAFALFVSLGV